MDNRLTTLKKGKVICRLELVRQEPSTQGQDQLKQWVEVNKKRHPPFGSLYARLCAEYFTEHNQSLPNWARYYLMDRRW